MYHTIELDTVFDRRTDTNVDYVGKDLVRVNTMTSAIGAVMIAAGAVACSTPSTAGGEPAPTTATQLQVAPQLQVPSGNKLIGEYDGVGVQVYQCTNSSWALLEPTAVLSDKGKPAAVHFKGPIWVSTIDGSEVGATPVPNATVSHDDAIPELLLKASEHHGNGQFESVTYVQRLVVKGGVAPQGKCAAGTQRGVPYSATYRFYAAE